MTGGGPGYRQQRSVKLVATGPTSIPSAPRTDLPKRSTASSKPPAEIARGFRNFTNYRLGCLLAAGSHRPYRLKQTNHA
jgi:hypothetical protein